MGILEWFEKRLFLGEIIQDYGELQVTTQGITKTRTSVLLCQKKGKMQLVFRNAARAPLGASVNYTLLDINPSSLSRLIEIVTDVHQRM